MTEQPKTGQPSTTPPEPQYVPVVPYPQGYNGAYPPVPHPGFPTFFAYPPNPDGSHPENGQNGGPPPHYMLFPPPPPGMPGMPGMVYAFPPGAGFTVPPPPQAAPNNNNKPKRKQVKMACTNCAQACKRCDETRPCERCVKYGLSESCIDGQRKERKKGIKRGPYRRKVKVPDGADRSEGEWTQGAPPIATPATTAAAIHAVAQFTTPEGYALYYPPGPYMPHPHDGQEGSPSHPNGHPLMPLFVHPGGFPPYPYAPPGMFPSPPHPAQAAQPPAATAQPAQTISPVDASKKPDETNGTTNGTTPAATPVVEAITTTTKKRSRASKGGESKSKRSKNAKGKEKEDEASKKGGAPATNGATVNGDHEEGDGVESTDG
ncbi:hypothetical protein BDN72DRAFT_834832 [Pluteus cervinus]|uniref:Uncharacterized protein n=1 Tax=Pluteus cervinus TaxID=181527 RepID=A0ACD3B5N5_9AGAR|nr:hypothetical protein BDN72DRAFT_834832 [Pluteus cervinus]